MIRVESYLRNDDGTFTAIADVDRAPSDTFHVEGAIELVVDDVRILDQELWDDVNWLWPYLCNVAEDLAETGRGTTSFPDQPIEVIFERRGGGTVAVTCAVPDERTRTAVAGELELLEALHSAASAFFTKLTSLTSADPSFATALRKLEHARQQAAGA